MIKSLVGLLYGLCISVAAAAQGNTTNTGNMSKTLHYLKNINIKAQKENKDSVARAMYRRAFTDAAANPKPAAHTTGSGFEIDNVITGLINRISGKHKRGKHFVEDYLADQQDASLYHPSVDLIIIATHLPEDSARLFQQYCRLPVDFAAGAGTLELMMPIRNSYKEWLLRPKQ